MIGGDGERGGEGREEEREGGGGREGGERRAPLSQPALCVNVPLPLFIDAGYVKRKTLHPSDRTLNGGPV